jgi:spermidine synthase
VTAALGLQLEDERIRTIIGDARVVLEHTAERYDVVLGDAFNGLSVPWHLTTVEFLRRVESRLAPDGIYVVNLLDSGELAFARAQVRTLQAVFPEVVVLLAPGADDGASPVTNVVVAAGTGLPSAEAVEVAARNRGSASIALGPFETRAFAEGAPLLTDDFAPVDQLIGRD